MLPFYVKDCVLKSKMKMLNYSQQNATQVRKVVRNLIGEGKAYKAYEVLKDCQNNANRYKFALTCVKLNKLNEAEKALLNRKNQRPLQQQDQNLLSQVPNGAAGLYLLGHVAERQSRRKEAIDYYTKALQIDPTMWCAFERLAKLQVQIDPVRVFNDQHPSIVKNSQKIRDFMQYQANSFQQQQQVQASPSHQDKQLTIATA